jgi:hypothetical protein
MTRIHLGALLCLCAVVVACGAQPSVRATEPWPEAAGAYREAYDRHTRHASARNGYDTVLDAFATLKASAWRAAYVAELARRTKLSGSERDALATQEKDADSQAWEIELLCATWRPAWNDFAKESRSMWRVVLVGDDGREVTPIKVERDRRQRGVIESYFFGAGPFHKAYVLTFPKTAADGQPLVAPDGPSRLALRIGGALGQLEMEWKP